MTSDIDFINEVRNMLISLFIRIILPTDAVSFPYKKKRNLVTVFTYDVDVSHCDKVNFSYCELVKYLRLTLNKKLLLS